jgi:uncharacterized membrane protein
MTHKKQRIWELDAFRGLCILCMVVIHFVYDLRELYQLVSFDYPAFFVLLKDWGGVLFLLISGISVTLGHKSVQRGSMVFACGLLCTAVTAGMYLLGYQPIDIIIWFGVLHCLGACMLLWPVFGKLPVWALGILGTLLMVGGYGLRYITAPWDYLAFLGYRSAAFTSSDYFPLLPNLGWFLLGAWLGRTVYREKRSLFSRGAGENPIFRGLGWCGRHSLQIYLLHQPVLAVVCLVWSLFA